MLESGWLGVNLKVPVCLCAVWMCGAECEYVPVSMCQNECLSLEVSRVTERISVRAALSIPVHS